MSFEDDSNSPVMLSPDSMRHRRYQQQQQFSCKTGSSNAVKFEAGVDLQNCPNTKKVRFRKRAKSLLVGGSLSANSEQVN